MTPTSAPPSNARMMLACIVALAGSLGADAAIVKITTSLDPVTRGFSHFRVIDYSLLTTLGVVTACVAWPIAIRISSSPRTLFFRLAIPVTVALWIPDAWLLLRHEPTTAVGALMIMHLVIALITYNVVVNIAVPQNVQLASAPGAQNEDMPAERAEITSSPALADPRHVSRRAWTALLTATCLEFALGIAALIFVPYGRPSVWISTKGEFVYLAHAALGALLVMGAIAALLVAVHDSRIARIGAILGVIGVVVGAIGGTLSVDHALRLVGMALMLLGGGLAFFGYLTPLVEPAPRPAEDPVHSRPSIDGENDRNGVRPPS